jgi:regulator of sigma E protease
MIDESMDTKQMQEAPKEWEFRSKPTWQRLIIMLGGVTVNLILGFLIYMMILFVWGKNIQTNAIEATKPKNKINFQVYSKFENHSLKIN